ncbi:MAG TPA: glucose-6-phosphate dehydrogenase [Bacteroidales bacterium]|nr:glucose-6-phosphate dehydrogenase [Bacteroidales bacterium]
MQKPENHLIVIFGASGDLTRRKLVPALNNLFDQGLMPEKFAIIGLGRTEMNDESFRDELRKGLKEFSSDLEVKDDFINALHYRSIDYARSESYLKLTTVIKEFKASVSFGNNILFYLATPPNLYEVIPENLANAGLNRKGHKIIIEKPFGTDLYSARQLNARLQDHFSEDQIYRIDHYLGKETVQNILVTRFSNNIYEPLWNRNFIHHVEITSAESIGVGKRGGYYDHSGALRDMVQNHLLQLAGLVAMEPPVNADATSIRNEMVKVFQSLRPLKPEFIFSNVIRGQYSASTIRGESIRGYRDEEGVGKNSRTETFVAMKFFIDNWRWNGIPFYVRTGKRLPTKVTELVIHFKPTPQHIFCDRTGNPNESNQLIIRIQPDEGILMKFGMKIPGAGFNVQTVNMDFHYASLSNKRLPEAYERLLHDCMVNDPTLYSRGDAVETTWKFLEPVLNLWQENDHIPLYGYPVGTWGPEIADKLIEEPDITWRYPCKNLTNDGIYCEL